MPLIVALIVAVGLVSPSLAQETVPEPGARLVAQAAGTAGPPDVGPAHPGPARGLITEQLAPGMFINPTSGTLRRLQLDLQYCALIYRDPNVADEQTAVAHGVIAGFGVTDRLEVGAAGLHADLAGEQDDPTVGGPMARLRVLEEAGRLPQVSVGGVLLFGDDPRERYTAYVAASKVLYRRDAGLLRSARGHVGFRQSWVDVGTDGSFAYVGVEVGLPRHVYVVAETSNKSGGVDKQPWAAGLQVRHPDGFGFTLAAVQHGTVKSPAIYVGVGINFQ
jgi:hypothetical protein